MLSTGTHQAGTRAELPSTSTLNQGSRGAMIVSIPTVELENPGGLSP
jgi:hypothetical protein